MRLLQLRWLVVWNGKGALGGLSGPWGRLPMQDDPRAILACGSLFIGCITSALQQTHAFGLRRPRALLMPWTTRAVPGTLRTHLIQIHTFFWFSCGPMASAAYTKTV